MLISIVNNIAESFQNNLLAENRYQMILDGLQVTLLITFCAAVLGTLLGGLVCWARMSRRTWLQRIAKVYIDLMRGTPVLVLLMLMYYVLSTLLRWLQCRPYHVLYPQRRVELAKMIKNDI